MCGAVSRCGSSEVRRVAIRRQTRRALTEATGTSDAAVVTNTRLVAGELRWSYPHTDRCAVMRCLALFTIASVSEAGSCERFGSGKGAGIRDARAQTDRVRKCPGKPVESGMTSSQTIPMRLDAALRRMSNKGRRSGKRMWGQPWAGRREGRRAGGREGRSGSTGFGGELVTVKSSRICSRIWLTFALW